MTTLDDIEGFLPKDAKERRLPYTHRYQGSAVYEEEGQRFYETWVPPTFPVRADDRYVSVSSNGYTGRLYLVSHEVYGTPRLWWVLALANDIIDPFEPLHPERILRVPNLTQLFASGILEVR